MTIIQHKVQLSHILIVQLRQMLANKHQNLQHHQLYTCSVTEDVMNPKAYSPTRGCLMMATSLKACVFWSEQRQELSYVSCQIINIYMRKGNLE